MDVQQCRNAALAVVMAVVAFGCASSNNTPKPGPVGGTQGFTSKASSHLATGEGVRLKLTNFKKEYGGGDYSYITTCPGSSGAPDEVSESSDIGFCYGSYHADIEFKNYDTGFFFYYDILIPNGSGGWMPSGYWLDAATKVPMMGTPLIDCTIRKSGGRVPGNPFRCEKSFTGSGNTSEPHWKVTVNPVQVIDASTSANVDRAAQLISTNCQIFDTPGCTWTRTQKSSAYLADRKDWKALTGFADSCPPTDPQHLFVLTASMSKTVSWSDTVGGKISASMEAEAFVGKVGASVEVNYAHSITQADSYGEGYQYTIPYNYRSALYLQHGMLEVTGDFSIITESGERFLIKNAVFQFPLQNDVNVDGRGQPVPRGVVTHVDLPCSEKPPALGAPPPAHATVGLVTKKTP